MQWWTQSFNRKLSLGIGAFLLLPILHILSGMGSFSLFSINSIFFFFGLFWVYIVCVALLLEWAILHFKKQSPPELPFGPSEWRGTTKTKYLLIGYVVLFSLIREGSFYPDFIINVQWYWSESSFNQQYNTSTSFNSSDGSTPSFAGKYTHCQITCSGDSAFCTAFQEQLKCDNHKNVVKNPQQGDVFISGNISFGPAPFCYTPLYKEANESYQANLTLNTATPQATKGGSLSINGNISQSLWGISSCFAFSQMIGQQTANQTANTLNQFIQSN